MIPESYYEKIKDLEGEIRELRRENLKLKMHMQVLVSHPVGLAMMMIFKKYSREKINKEIQISTQN